MKCCVGIDYSLCCPAVCVHLGDIFSLSNCQFFFLTDRKKFELISKQFHGYPHRDYNSPEQRYDQLSDWVLSHTPKAATIAIEGYSFGSRGGRAFDIGEAGGILKHKLYKANYKVEIVPPTVVKKVASGKGNADKILMGEAFQKETGRDLYCEFNCSLGKSPIADIIDSFYVCKIGYLNNNK
jgi:hypothetical protein